MNKAVYIIIIIILIIFNAFLIYQNKILEAKIDSIAQDITTKATFQVKKPLNFKAAEFLNLFVKKVLLAKEAPDFKTKLELNQAVYDIQDNAILEQWYKFINSTSEEETTMNLKILLELLSDKILNK
ncbi:MAG: hypothetical protein KatS3mg097_060 [Candidatus Parcubacteria bacterium]|nr:MAG: hypothetical protein KatS3mg097_060 [Candidatus Parcubacteria bacterium]